MAEVLAEAYDGSLPLGCLTPEKTPPTPAPGFSPFRSRAPAGVPQLTLLQEAADRGPAVILLTCDPASPWAIEPAGRVRLGGLLPMP